MRRPDSPRVAAPGIARSAVIAALFAALVAACQSTPPPATAPAQPLFRTTGTAARVVLMSFDGLGADELASFGAPSLASMPARVARVIPINPTATAATHAAILTGSTPDHTGVVANLFHRPGTPVQETARGLDEPIATETLLDACRRAGKRVVSIAFPTIDGKSARRTPDWAVLWTEYDTQPRLVELHRSDFRRAGWLPPTWKPATPKYISYSTLLQARVSWDAPEAGHRDVDITAADTTDDGVENYDRFYVDVDGVESPLDANGWFSVTRHGGGRLYGSWSKILSSDATLSTVTVYWGPVTHTEAVPVSFQQALDEEVGVWPGKPDEPSARRWIAGGAGIDGRTFAEQNDRLSSFVTRATALALRTTPADLVLTYQPIIDEAEHVFRIDSPSQLHYSDRTRQAGEHARRQAFSSMERSVGAMRKVMNDSRDALIVTGDHGLASADTEVGLNHILAGWGLATTAGNRLSAETHWGAYATGNVAMLYRFSGPADDALVADKLKALRAPDGQPVFESVTRRSASSHPNSGDIVALSHPRFALTSAGAEPFAKTMNYGQHGGLNTHAEFHTTLFAAGAGVPAQTLEKMPQTEIAPLVARLLGIAPPASLRASVVDKTTEARRNTD